MYRACLAVLMMALLALSIGCGAKEIDPDANTKFSTDTEAAAKGMQESMAKSGDYMRPEQKDYMNQMLEKMKQGAPGAPGAKGPGQ